MPRSLYRQLLAELLGPVPEPLDGAALRAWRQARGLSQRQLAEALGVRRATITAWERHGPAQARLVALALRALAVAFPPR